MRKTEQEQWWEERNGQLFCKEDGVELQQLYVPTNHKGGWFDPPFKCPKCNREEQLKEAIRG